MKSYNRLLLLWVLVLFEPARLVSHFVPILGPLKWIPELMLYWLTFKLLGLPVKKYGYPWFAAFLALTLFGTVNAFLQGNWGVARDVNRLVTFYFLLGLMTYSLLSQHERIDKIIYLYLLYFLYYAVWGIISLKIAPISAFDNAGMRSIVFWHHYFDNRDGFGPLMVMGLAFSFYYFQASGKVKQKRISLVTAILCLIGIVSSFGRGVFLAMTATALYIWFHSQNRLKGLLVVLVGVFLLVVIVSTISPGTKYWDTINSIGEGTKAGTGADRKVLWGWAWREFIDNPIFGVGTRNFGIALPRYVDRREAAASNYTEGRLWGRALHCAPMTILSEYGVVGCFIFFPLILDFVRTNCNRRQALRKAMNAATSQDSREDPDRLKFNYYIIEGLMACFIAFWVNAFFYEILYTPLFWVLIILNRLVCIFPAKEPISKEVPILGPCRTLQFGQRDRSPSGALGTQ